MSEIKVRSFESQILYFNGMYKLPVAPFPSSGEVVKVEAAKTGLKPDKNNVLHRLAGFKHTLLDEVDEVKDIIASIQTGVRIKDGEPVEPQEEYTETEFLVDLADWLGDIQVYCASEMAKFGIPIADTLKIIMSSNFSKLQSDGTALYDSNGKVQKGPAYWKPEPMIKQMLLERIMEAAPVPYIPGGIIWRDGETAASSKE